VVNFPQGPVETVCVHLDANSTQRHRCRQMERIVSALNPELPVVLGGDWNTSTHNSSHALWAILGYCLRVAQGVDNSIRNHYLHPERRFERRLFQMLEKRGLDYRRSNVPGEYTMYHDVNDARVFRNLGEWVPGWCFSFIRWALRNHQGRCPMKLDWFATRGLRVENPTVVHGLHDREGHPLSDHDPVGIDVAIPGRG
jgi:endonuclease/exonuclease/phosphatase family metal-dependent hydrolase